MLTVSLKFTGEMATQSEIDLYDAGQALIGFQRSLALTTHLILNGEIITQAPSLEGARIIARVPEEGSWKVTAAIVTAIYTAGTAPKDTPLGHLISSAYDYVISEALGFHVDYEKTIGQQLKELKSTTSSPIELPQTKLDSLVEKCETAVREIHRPIAKSRTASEAIITAKINSVTRPIGPTLNLETYEYISVTEQSDAPLKMRGLVSSYNINTFKGRVFVPDEGRPIPFELAETSRDQRSINLITSSLVSNAQGNSDGYISFFAFKNMSRTGRLKGLLIVEMAP